MSERACHSRLRHRPSGNSFQNLTELFPGNTSIGSCATCEITSLRMLQVAQQSLPRARRGVAGLLGATTTPTGNGGRRAWRGHRGVIESTDDGTILQQNGRSSELSFCCIRGHFAILPLTQILPRACTARCATCVLNPSSLIRPAHGCESKPRAKDVGRSSHGLWAFASPTAAEAIALQESAVVQSPWSGPSRMPASSPRITDDSTP